MMMFRKWAVALAAAALFACVPALAQKISDLPAATTLTGNEKVPAIQGTGCAAHAAPCSNVALTTTQLATLANATTQPLDAELTALAGQTTAANRCQYWTGPAAAGLYDCTSFVRGLGASSSASSFRTALGAAAVGANSDITSLAAVTAISSGTLSITGLSTYASDTAAGTAGLTSGQIYKTSDGSGGFNLKIKS